MKTAPLGKLTTLISSGSTPLGGAKIYLPSGPVMLIRSQNVLMRELNLNDVAFITEEIASKMQRTVVTTNDVLLNITGASIGRVATFELGEKANVNQHVCIIRTIPELLHHRYLMHFIAQPSFQTHIDSTQDGGTRQALTFEKIRNFQIPLPPIAEQRRIAAILDRADAVRRKRQEAIALTEELLRSAFLEMFGDPVTNPKGWNSGTILDVVADPKSDVRCGPFGTQLKVEEIVSEGIPLLGIENVKGGRFRESTNKFLTPTKAKELSAFDVKADDVLVTRMGTIGHACVAPKSIEEARFSYHLFRVRPHSKKCLPGFLASTITWSGTFLTQLERLAHGAIMAGLKTADLKEVRFLIPPVDLQEKYLKIVSETETLLQHQKERLVSDDALFNSLIQRAFRGEL